MATQTTHYSLVKPAYEDQADVGVLNGDLDQIDELIYTANNDVRSVGKGGTGASTAAAARENLGLGSVLQDVADLQEAADGVVLLRKSMASNNGTWVFTFSGTCALQIITNGASENVRSIIWVYCTGAGAVSVSRNNAGSATSINTNTGVTNKLTVTNSSSYTTFAMAVVYGNPENVSAT